MQGVLLSLSAWLKWALAGGLWTTVRLMTLRYYPFPIPPPPPQPLVYREIFLKVITMLSHLLFSFLSSILSFTGWSVSGAGGADGSCPVSLCLQQRMVYQLQEMSSGLNGSVMCTTDGRTL